MDLKHFLPTREEKEDAEFYWSFVLEPNWVHVGIWKVVDGRAKMVTISAPNAWDLEEELVTAADASLSAAIQSLDNAVKEPEKTVFGIYSSWVSEGQIKKEYLHLIKHICSELSLKPAGFVILSEAIANYIKSEEGAPLSGIVLGLMEEDVEVTVFKLGNIIGTTQVSRSMSLSEDVVEGLTRLKIAESLPSRFVLFNTKEAELEEVKQTLLETHWDDFDKIKFLHTPKVEMISPEMKVGAVSLAGAVDIAQVTKLSKTKKEQIAEPEEVEEKVVVSPSDDNVESISPEELGFVLNGDVSSVSDVVSDTKVETTPPVVTLSGKKPKEESEKDHSRPEVSKKPTKYRKRFSFKLKSKPKIAKVRGKWSTGKKATLIGLVTFIALGVGGFALWWFYPKAEVTVYLSANSIQEKVDIILDPAATSPDYAQAVLPGRVLTLTVSADKTKQTSGTKTVGEAATGEVKLFRVGTEVTLDRGSIVSGPSGLVFTLDDDVKIASGSASTPGTSIANVTANSIGANYNLASNSTFEIEGYSLSDIEAKSESSFSGGASREISAVSEKDMKSLSDDLSDELKSKALLEFAEILKQGIDCDKCRIVEESYSVVNSTAKYSAKEGDEATSIELSLSNEIQVLSVSDMELNQFTQSLLIDRIPNDYVLRDDQIDTIFEYNEEVDGKYFLTATIVANLLPTVSPDDITQKIAGKYPLLAEDYLVTQVAGFVRAEIVLNPKLPGRLGTLPHVPGNIEVIIAADKVPQPKSDSITP